MSGYSGPITPQEQKQNLTDLILTLHDRNARLQSEIERLRGRVNAYESVIERTGLAIQRGYISGESVIQQLLQAAEKSGQRLRQQAAESE